MLFNSLSFIIFLFVVVLVYYLIPRNRYRNIFLLLASYYFYACYNYTMLAILLFETILAYGFGILKNKTKISVVLTVVSLLLPLFCFKYLNFLMGMVGDALALSGFLIQIPSFEMLLPIGISFYTFMSVGYVVDVYKGKIEAERNALDLALFVGFFPQIASGPIGRPGQLIPQFKEIHPILYRNIAAGTKMMLWGFFMKLVVGDRAGIYVDTVFGNYTHHNGTSLLLATLMYTIQIYCDFAGYSLIATGAAKMMGIDLIENFRRPYFATSVADFWRKWHISLSTWFRDYVYFPCGGSRCSSKKTYRNLMITFLVSGLWHGAAYNFILWGFYHGANQVFGKVLIPIKEKCRRLFHIGDESLVRKLLDVTMTFCLVAYGWMIFYAPDLVFIKDVTKGYFRFGTPYIHQTTIFFFLIGFVVLLTKDLKDEFFLKSCLAFEKRYPIISKMMQYVVFSLLIIMIVWIGVLSGGQFIYFKF